MDIFVVLGILTVLRHQQITDKVILKKLFQGQAAVHHFFFFLETYTTNLYSLYLNQEDGDMTYML